MLKPNEILVIDGKKHLIKQCKMFEKCVKCKEENGMLPCLYFRSMNSGKFNTNICHETIPENCYPVLQQPNDVSGEVRHE